MRKQTHCEGEVYGAPPPARDVARQLSPVWHSGRNPKSDRMRRPSSLAGSERGEIKSAGTKPLRYRDHSEITKRSQINEHSQVLLIFTSHKSSTNGSAGCEFRTRSGPVGMECRNAKTNSFVERRIKSETMAMLPAPNPHLRSDPRHPPITSLTPFRTRRLSTSPLD